jgi:hypothetical protein
MIGRFQSAVMPAGGFDARFWHLQQVRSNVADAGGHAGTRRTRKATVQIQLFGRDRAPAIGQVQRLRGGRSGRRRRLGFRSSGALNVQISRAQTDRVVAGFVTSLLIIIIIVIITVTFHQELQNLIAVNLSHYVSMCHGRRRVHGGIIDQAHGDGCSVIATAVTRGSSGGGSLPTLVALDGLARSRENLVTRFLPRSLVLVVVVREVRHRR